VEQVSNLFGDFLMVGECWNLDILDLLDFKSPEWEKEMKTLIRQKAELRGPSAIDYFVFRRGFYERIPAFGLGRPAFDNWLIWKARSLKAAVVDGTRFVTAVHQNHDFSHVVSPKSKVREADGGERNYGQEAKQTIEAAGGRWHMYGEEARRNIEIAGGIWHLYNITESTHFLTQTAVKANLRGRFCLAFLKRVIKVETRRLFFWFLKLSGPIRHRLGLRSATINRFRSYLSPPK
jgi:hypothetical protein